jgi:hypothetical protein
MTVANDNAAPAISRAEDDRKVAAIATRCLGMVRAPEERMAAKVARERWGIAQFVMNEIRANEQATVEQTVVAIEVLASWQQYWGRFHRNERERGRCLVAWMNTNIVLKEHKEQNANGYPVNS